MTPTEIQEALDWVFDQAIVFFGFTDYIRDYEVVTFAVADPSTRMPPAHERYVFRHCVEASVRTELTPDIWWRLLDDELTAPENHPRDGYHWGVRWQCIYPGVRIVEESEAAARWSETVGIDFHEAVIETNGHQLRLIFSDLTVLPAGVGYAPFVVRGP